MNFSLRTDGLFDTSKLNAWTAEAQKRNRAAVKRALTEGGRAVAKATNADVSTQLGVKRKGFPSFKGKVYDTKPGRMPSLLVYSRVPWLNIHATGGTVTSQDGLWIPINLGRVGPGRWKRFLNFVFRSKRDVAVVNVNGKKILFVRKYLVSDSNLVLPSRVFRARFRKLRSSAKGSGDDYIPVAVNVPSVTLRKRFSIETGMRRELPGIVRKIEQYIAE